MQREQQTDVLVVGAGPVGMLAASILARNGISTRIIDQECRTASRTYACALHPRTLQVLNRLDLARDLIEAGRRIDTVAFYCGRERRGEIKISELQTDFPFVLVSSQSAFESLLEKQIGKQSGVQIEWNHRLARLKLEGGSAVAEIEKLVVSAKGFIVPEMDWEVQKSEIVRASWVIGADGPKSSVASSINLGHETIGEPEFFAVYEFESDWALSNELRVVLDENTISVLWPLPGRKFRWSFQLLQEHMEEFPSKDRTSLLVEDVASQEANRAFVRKLVKERAPWFSGSVEELGWSSDVEFHRRLAKRFGLERCWLAGDAAHQTGPAGMQSMNVGLLEGAQLAEALCQIMREKASLSLLDSYNQGCRSEWQRLLGVSGLPKGISDAKPWFKDRAGRVLSCIPSAREDLVILLRQLGLEWDWSASPKAKAAA